MWDPKGGKSVSQSYGNLNKQGLSEMTPKQRAAANARAHRKPGFTPEGIERLRQAAHKNRPWAKSTGPTSPEGKARSTQNAFKGGYRGRLELSQAWRNDLGKWLDALDLGAARAQVATAVRKISRTTVSTDYSHDGVAEAANPGFDDGVGI